MIESDAFELPVSVVLLPLNDNFATQKPFLMRIFLQTKPFSHDKCVMWSNKK